MKEKKLIKMIQKNEKNQPFSDCYLQTVNPWAISEKLLKGQPGYASQGSKSNDNFNNI